MPGYRSRADHLEWCKTRARVYIESGDYNQAFSSMVSDLGKHPETADHIAISMGMQMLVAGLMSTQAEITRWVEGFN